uniref:Uncharacterized protein n=1 Tax=uncultured Desulfobacterium sp. TaxID=201089 RepID=E1YJR5_9BACT|nr:unknown protein [uncultured Desulfobacterium sp.]
MLKKSLTERIHSPRFFQTGLTGWTGFLPDGRMIDSPISRLYSIK